MRGLARLLYFARKALMGRYVIAYLPGSVNILLDSDDYFQCMMAYDRYAPEVMEIAERIVGPGDRVVDVGAQVGYVTLKLSALVGPGGHVYSVEPDPRAREQLVRSIGMNGQSAVTVLPVALGSERTVIPFFLSPVLGWSTAVAGSHLKGLTTVEVECAPFDELVTDGTIAGPIRLVKIDVEGREPRVLAGMQNTLTRDRPALLVEINRSMLSADSSTPDDLIQFLEDLGYLLFLIERAPAAWLRRNLGRLNQFASGEDLEGDMLCLHRDDPQVRKLSILHRTGRRRTVVCLRLGR